MRTILFILLCISSAVPVNAQANLLKYSYRHFSTENGLTQNSLSDAVFDKNGYLWISIRTDNVFVYDGYRFTPCWFYDNGKKTAFKSASLFCNTAGDIFIAHEKGIHVRDQRTGTFISVSRSLISRENEEITFIGEGKEQDIYFFNQETVFVLHTTNGGGYRIDPLLTGGIAGFYFERKVDTARRRSFFWFSQRNEDVLHLYDMAAGKVIKNITSIGSRKAVACFAVDSSLYYLGNNLTFYKANPDGHDAVTMPDNIFRPNMQWQSNTFSDQSNGDVFFGSNEYLYKTNRSFTKLPVQITNTDAKPILAKGNITKILQQDPAHLWLFTASDGIYQLDVQPKKFEHFKTGEGNLNFVRSLYKDESTGNIFSGLFYGGLVIYSSEGKIIKTFPMPAMNKEDKGGFCVNGISKLSNNIYLIWYNAGRAYILNSADWSLKSIINSGQAWQENYNAVVTDYAGYLQLGTNNFASGYKKRIYFFHASTEGIKIYDSIVTPLFRPEGFYYSGSDFYYGGIGSFYRYNTVTKKTDSIAITLSTKVKWISRDKYNRLWISTETGIVLVDDKIPGEYKIIKTITIENGLPNHYIYVAEPDDRGKMWCSSNNGVFSVDINNYAVTGYSTVDGLQSEEFNTGAFCKDSSGFFYFGGVNGFNSFQPGSIKETGKTALVHMSYIASGDSVIYQYPGGLFPSAIEMNYKQPSLLLRFSALNYNTQGFNGYEYKLHAADSLWTDNSNKNELQLLLLPGKYEILVRLKNNPVSVIQLTVHVTGPFYQTIWFALLVIAVIAILVAWIVSRHNKNKYRKKIALFEMQQKVQEERERISRDLHDNLGVQANAILHNSSLLDPGKENYQHIVTNLQDTAKEMLLNLRETLWAMKTTNVTARDLWLRIINFMKQMGRHYTNIDFKVEGEVPTDFMISSNKALNIVLVIQESVNNAVKHADANTISAVSVIENDQWTISVTDDGSGFDMNEVNKNTDSYGLLHMQERAAAGNFVYTIETALGKGTVAKMILVR